VKAKARCVFDASVLVSALLFPDSKPGRAFRAVLRDGAVLLSVPVLEELHDVLSRPKFDRYLLREERDLFLSALVREVDLQPITEVIRACRDPKDDKYLELAASGQADYIITGDQDLLELDPSRVSQ